MGLPITNIDRVKFPRQPNITMKLYIHTKTRNKAFCNSLHCIQPLIKSLSLQLEKIDTSNCRYKSIDLTFKDDQSDVFSTIHRSFDQNTYEITTGYDYDKKYFTDKQFVIRLIEEKLLLAIDNCKPLAPWKNEFIKIITNWASKAIGVE